MCDDSSLRASPMVGHSLLQIRVRDPLFFVHLETPSLWLSILCSRSVVTPAQYWPARFCTIGAQAIDRFDCGGWEWSPRSKSLRWSSLVARQAPNPATARPWVQNRTPGSNIENLLDGSRLFLQRKTSQIELRVSKTEAT